MNNRYSSILDTIGQTPTVRLNHIAPDGVEVYVKLEAFNPSGSVKDRFALAAIEAAEESGALKPGQTVIEATSGNTGIGLAVVCAQKGYPLVIVMAENFSIERRKLLRFLGAKVVLTPAVHRGTGMIAKAEELAAKHGWFLASQFDNDANADMHSRTTAREIMADFEGDRLDYFVSGYGTGGTLQGVARVLKQERPDTRIVACEPDNSALLSSQIPQPFDASGKRTSHPTARPHPVQGWGPDFIPKFAENAAADGLIDELLPVNGQAGIETARAVAVQEGIFCGTSGGATLAAALEVASRAEPGSKILCMLPDTGERYLSTPLFKGVEAEMNTEEHDISNSTELCRFNAPAPTPAPKTATPKASPIIPLETERDSEAEDFVASVLADRSQPVAIFALEWCEFCWSVRNFLDAAGIGYRSIDLDSVAFQKNEFGGRIRKVLNARTRITSIPQVFVGGEFVGGCTETFDAYSDGSLQQALTQSNFGTAVKEGMNPYEFLPNWIAKNAIA